MDPLVLLKLQIEWGADEALSDVPVDRLRPVATAAPKLEPEPASPARQMGQPAAALGFAGQAAERAAVAAAEAESLAELREAIARFDGCALRETASNLVFAEGDPGGRLLLIGDPPGADEDRAGHPFAGAEGALLDAMLASIGLARSALLLAPLIPWRPPGGRPPNPPELAVCLPFLIRVIELAAPRHIVLFGALVSRTLLPGRRRTDVWTDLNGRWGTIPTIVLPGLGALLKDASRRKEAWAGLRRLRRALDGVATGGS